MNRKNKIKSNKSSVPKILYRYRSAQSRELDALRENHLYLSNPIKFDDPWDCALIDSESVLHVIKSFGVACFATNDTDPRFWSHYANCHEGICIGYHVDKLPIHPWEIHEVKYSNSHPRFPKKAKRDSLELINAATQLLTKKCKAWKPQKEW